DSSRFTIYDLRFDLNSTAELASFPCKSSIVNRQSNQVSAQKGLDAVNPGKFQHLSFVLVRSPDALIHGSNETPTESGFMGASHEGTCWVGTVLRLAQ